MATFIGLIMNSKCQQTLLIKGKVSKICEFFDAEYDVNTVLRLDPHYRT